MHSSRTLLRTRPGMINSRAIVPYLESHFFHEPFKEAESGCWPIEQNHDSFASDN